jgi:FG-GAP repeat
MTQTAKLTASDGLPGDEFGTVGISGSTVVVGAREAPFHGTSGPGKAYIFVKPRTGWTDMTQTALLTAADGAPHDLFGLAAAISGNTAVVVSPVRHGGPGAAYVFAEPSGGWRNMTQNAELSTSDGVYPFAVSISRNAVVAGAQYANNSQGALYVFVKHLSGWIDMTETAKLTGGKYALSFGLSVAFSANTIVGGAPDTHTRRGAAYVFVKPARGWKTTSRFTSVIVPGDGMADEFGNSVAISGNTIAVGAPAANRPHGAAFVFGH